MASGNLATQSAGAERIPIGKVLRVGGLAVIASVLANLVLLVLVNLAAPQPGFPPLTVPPIALFTAVGSVAAVVVFAVLSRLVSQPGRLYVIIGLVAFVLSCIPNVLAASDPAASPLPGATSTGFLLLILFHIPPAVICIWLLATRTRAL